MDQVISDPEVLIQKNGAVGHIVLNRPHVLNALSMDMIRHITFALENWKNDPSVKAVFIEGAGERAFCAGGDIKGFYAAGMDYRRGKISLDVAMLYFKEEYELNKLIFNYVKPIVAYMNGITMGGGFGIAGHCRYRLVSEKTVFAMPEAIIGFFPDVGSMYHLSKLPGFLGLYLALTGETLSGTEMLACGLGEHYVSLEKKEALLLDLSQSSDDDINSIILKHSKNVQSASNEAFLNKIKAISNAFSQDSLNGILEYLGIHNDEQYHAQILAKILKNAPDSVCVAYEYYQRAQHMDFDAIIDQDLILARNFAKGPDFYEGIRAAVLDKDKSPQWHRESISEISAKDIEFYFK